MASESKTAEMILGAAGLAGAGIFGYLYSQAEIQPVDGLISQQTADNVNAIGVRGLVVIACMARFGPSVSVAIVRACMLIVIEESEGSEANTLGDTGSSLPSIGLMQVNGTTAVALGYVPAGISSDAYAAYASSAWTGIWWGVGVFKNKLASVGGDIAQAVQAYNGSGDAAVAYEQTADTNSNAEGWGELG